MSCSGGPDVLLRAQPFPAHQAGQSNGQQLCQRARPRQDHRRRHQRNGQALAVGAQRAPHRPHGLGDHGDRDDLEPVQDTALQQARGGLDAIGKDHQHHRGRRGKSDPRSQGAGHAGTKNPERHSHLAAGGPGQKLAQGDEIGIGLLVEPAAPRHEFIAKISQVRDRAAERRESQPEKYHQHLENRASPGNWGRNLIRHDRATGIAGRSPAHASRRGIFSGPCRCSRADRSRQPAPGPTRPRGSEPRCRSPAPSADRLHLFSLWSGLDQTHAGKPAAPIPSLDRTDRCCVLVMRKFTPVGRPLPAMPGRSDLGRRQDARLRCGNPILCLSAFPFSLSRSNALVATCRIPAQRSPHGVQHQNFLPSGSSPVVRPGWAARWPKPC